MLIKSIIYDGVCHYNLANKDDNELQRTFTDDWIHITYMRARYNICDESVPPVGSFAIVRIKSSSISIGQTREVEELIFHLVPQSFIHDTSTPASHICL